MINLIKQLNVSVLNEKFYYLDFGKETHGKTSFRLWLSSKLVNLDDNQKPIIQFPVKANLIKTEKNNLVLKPDENYFVFPIETQSGFRGNSKFEIISPVEAIALKYYHYHSPLGALGIDENGLIITPAFPVKIKIYRTGRTYGKPKEGLFIIDLQSTELTLSEAPPEDVEQIL